MGLAAIFRFPIPVFRFLPAVTGVFFFFLGTTGIYRIAGLEINKKKNLHRSGSQKKKSFPRKHNAIICARILKKYCTRSGLEIFPFRTRCRTRGIFSYILHYGNAVFSVITENIEDPVFTGVSIVTGLE